MDIHKKRGIRIAVSFLALLASAAILAKIVYSLNRPFPHKEIVNIIDKRDLREPSGIVFYPTRKTLFIVGDQGDICEIKTDGAILRKKEGVYDRRYADFEGITYDPSTGFLYIAIEGKEKIIEVNPEDFSVRREFTIGRTFQGKTVLKKDRYRGIEAIAFVPDPDHPEGGTFYVANQGYGLDDLEDPPAILEIEAPLKSDPSKHSKAKIARYFSLGITDLSGLYYDQPSGHLYVISDKNDILLEITKDGEILRSYNGLPGRDQEGIAVDDEGFLYIAQDSGGVIKFMPDR